MQIIDRIYELIKLKKKHAYELCNVLGIRTSTMSTWKARSCDPPARYMKTIADFLGVSLEYLMTGEEAPVRKETTPEEDELLSYYRLLPAAARIDYMGQLKGYLKGVEDSQKYEDSEKRLSALPGPGKGVAGAID